MKKNINKESEIPTIITLENRFLIGKPKKYTLKELDELTIQGLRKELRLGTNSLMRVIERKDEVINNLQKKIDELILLLESFNPFYTEYDNIKIELNKKDPDSFVDARDYYYNSFSRYTKHDSAEFSFFVLAYLYRAYEPFYKIFGIPLDFFDIEKTFSLDRLDTLREISKKFIKRKEKHERDKRNRQKSLLTKDKSL